jgi:tetratricopeptide (TPR) repeat protein
MKRKGILHIIFLATASLIIACKQQKPQEKSDADKTAVTSVETDIDKFSKEINTNPDNAEAYYHRAKIYIEQKKFKLAFNDINKAITLDTTKADYYLMLGDVMFANMQVDQAIQAFQKSIDIDPGKREVYLKMAELHLYLKKYQESVHFANEALKLDKHIAKAYFIKGFVYKESGDTTKAISSFQTCLEQEPDNYDAHMQLGILYGAKKNKLAIEYYGNALRLNPKSTEALYDRGLFYQDKLEYNRAMEDYSTLLQIEPNNKDAHYNLGYIHLVYLKVYDQAIKHFTDAINSDPYFVQAYYNRGLCYEYLGDIAAAARDYKHALSIFPTYKLAIDGLKRVKE